MPRERSNAFSFSPQDHLWCPGLDQEMQRVGTTYINSMGLHPRILGGGRGELGAFTPTSKLYILCHGHSRMPLFKTTVGTWTAEQLVALLVADGLPQSQRDIELLVCHAGESVNTVSAGNSLLKIHHQAQVQKQKGGSLTALRNKFNKVQKKEGMEPAFFEGKDAAKMLLPMAAQLCSSLKNNGFTHFRVISYKAAVAQYCPDGKVYLDLTNKGGHWGVSVDKKPEYRTVWQ